VGIPGANAPGMGGGRLKLPRPSTAFFEHFRGFEFFSLRRRVSSRPPVPLGSACNSFLIVESLYLLQEKTWLAEIRLREYGYS
jgi:hypothetical protein